MKISINGIELLAVEVPEGARYFSLHKDQLVYLTGNSFDEKTNQSKWAFLPPGEYEPLGMFNQVTEEVAAGIVGEPYIGTYGNYLYNDEYFLTNGFRTALESLSSLIKSNGLEPNKTYLLKKK